jgi:hypothetical protein
MDIWEHLLISNVQIINNIKNVNINFNNLPNKSKLIWLMSSEDNFIIKNTSSLLCSLFKERDLVLKGISVIFY